MRIHRNLNTWQRWASIALGAALMVRAVRRPRVQKGLALSGLGFVSRGLGGFCPVTAALEGRQPVGASIGTKHRSATRSALAGRRGIRLAESIRIRRTPHEVYDFWRDLRNIPRFMPHIQRVDILNSTRSHWVSRGPAGLTVEWDAEVINERRPDLIGWQSVGNADLVSAGSVRFSEMADGSTLVDVLLQYDPPRERWARGSRRCWANRRTRCFATTFVV